MLIIPQTRHSVWGILFKGKNMPISRWMTFLCGICLSISGILTGVFILPGWALLVPLGFFLILIAILADDWR